MVVLGPLSTKVQVTSVVPFLGPCPTFLDKGSVFWHGTQDLSQSVQLICTTHHEKHWAGLSTSWNRIAGRNIKNLRYADDTTLMAEIEEELKSLLKMKV